MSVRGTNKTCGDSLAVIGDSLAVIPKPSHQAKDHDGHEIDANNQMIVIMVMNMIIIVTSVMPAKWKRRETSLVPVIWSHTSLKTKEIS